MFLSANAVRKKVALPLDNCASGIAVGVVDEVDGVEEIEVVVEENEADGVEGIEAGVGISS